MSWSEAAQHPREPRDRAAAALLLGLPLLWLSGVQLALAAPVLLVAWVLWERGEKQPSEAVVPPWLLRALAVLAVLLISAQLWARYRLGHTGLDFAIVAQLLDSAAAGRGLRTTLLGPAPRDFLGHHFSPVFLGLALPVRLGLGPAPTLVAANAASLLLTSLAIARFARRRGQPAFVQQGAALLWVLNPAVRSSFGWSLHDEHLAAPLLGWALVWLEEERPLPLLLTLALLATTKESLWPVAAVVCVLAARQLRRPVFLAGAALFAAGFCAYVFGQPALLGKRFDHWGKLATAEVLLSPEAWLAKATWLGALLLPVGALPLWRRAGAWLLWPAAPLVGLVLLSGFAELWKPLNYYAILPALCLHFAAVAAFAAPWPRAPLRLLAAATALAFCLGSVRPMGWIAGLWEEGPVSERALEQIGTGESVAASPAAAVRLLRVVRLTRLGDGAEAQRRVCRRVELEAQSLLGWGRDCGSDETWLVRCASPEQPPHRTKAAGE